MIARIILPIILAIVLPDIYIDIHYLSHRFKYKLAKRLLWLTPGVLMLVYSIILATIKNFVPDDLKWINLYFALVGLFVVPKAIYALCSSIGLLFCKIFRAHTNWGNLIGLLFLLFGVYIFLYGYTVGFHKLEVKHVDLYFADLPENFEGYRVVHFSDAHVGTYTDKRLEFLHRAIDSINAQKADMIVFTGDIQNAQPSELYPVRDLLSSVKAKDGVYSVLGNHDYSQYIKAAPAIKRANERETIYRERQFGWHLLLNQHKGIHRGKDSIIIAGEENDGLPPFPEKGDLGKTLKGVSERSFVIMLQHDPSAWRRDILLKTHAQLTLSGHTHGGQLSIFGFRPTMIGRKDDKGLYEECGRYLYVNSGLGGVIPFRFGVPSEITIITLHRSK